MMNERSTKPDPLPSAQELEAYGPWPFVTRRIRRQSDGRIVEWSSRHHRKGLVLREAARAEAFASIVMRSVWMPRKLNWWIGVVFAVGASHFAIASCFSLSPDWTRATSLTPSSVNAIYFVGSIFFTTAAYLQLFQAANANASPNHLRFIGWQPRDLGWLSCLLQFVGTVLFNFNTFDAMIPSHRLVPTGSCHLAAELPGFRVVLALRLFRLH